MESSLKCSITGKVKDCLLPGPKFALKQSGFLRFLRDVPKPALIRSETSAERLLRNTFVSFNSINTRAFECRSLLFSHIIETVDIKDFKPGPAITLSMEIELETGEHTISAFSALVPSMQANKESTIIRM